jgi:hypothetical protein
MAKPHRVVGVLGLCGLMISCFAVLKARRSAPIPLISRVVKITDTGLLDIENKAMSQPIEETQREKEDLTVFPTASSPGMIVRVTASQGICECRFSVLIGGKPATIQRALNAKEVNILVPVLPPGDAEVLVRDQRSKKRRATGKMTILQVISQQLILSFEKDKVKLLSAQPRAGEFTGWDEQDQRRLAFDVFNAQGGLIYTGSIVHPAFGRREVFEGHDGKKPWVHGVKPPERVVFAVKIPFDPKGAVVKFFDVLPQVDLNTEQGRNSRKYLNEVKVRPH